MLSAKRSAVILRQIYRHFGEGEEVNAAEALDVDVMMHLETEASSLNEVYPQVEFIVSVIE